MLTKGRYYLSYILLLIFTLYYWQDLIGNSILVVSRALLECDFFVFLIVFVFVELIFLKGVI